MPSKLGSALLALLLLTSCRSTPPYDPANTFHQIDSDFLHGQLDLARREAAKEKTKLRSSDPAWSFRFCLLEAEVLQFQGRSQELVQIIEQQRQTFFPQGDLFIKQNLLLALADARLGHAQRSTDELQEAKRLTQATHSKLEGEYLRTQGLLEDRKDQFEAAQSSLHASLEFARSQQNIYLEASDLLNIGRVTLQEEHIDESLDAFRASSRLAETIQANTILQSAEGNAGWASYTLGDFNGALHSFEKARIQAHALGATDSEILWLNSDGLALSHLGQWTRAQASYEEALNLAEETQNKTRQVDIHTSLASLFLKLGSLNAAESHAALALKIAHEVGDNASDASLTQALIAAYTSSNSITEQMLLHLLHEAADAPSIRWVLQDALASLFNARRLYAQAGQWHRKAIHTFETQRNSVEDEEQRLPFFANGDDLYRHYAESLITTHHPIQALSLLDSARARTLKDGLGDHAPHESILSAKYSDPRTNTPNITLFYSLGPHKSYLWEIDRSGVHLFPLPAEMEITAHIERYQASILKSRDPLLEANADSLWLYDKLISPIEAAIPSGSRVLVVADGALNGFNLETLLRPGPQGIHYWIEDVNLTIANSIQLFAQSRLPDRTPMPSKANLLLIGAPLSIGADYPALAHAAEEINKVQHYFPPTERTTLTQADAAPDAYERSHPEQYAYLHFVAHGTASNLRPLDSAIVLSPSSTDTDHFKLYAREIIHRPIRARLVTISSCYGSGARNYADEGLVGLSWAFLRAGAHQVIGALWEVNDSSTPQLMDHLYNGLTHGMPPDQALRAAKLNMLHSQGVFRKPLYWAAFQLYTGS
jgi:CHAT domain-containing protein